MYNISKSRQKIYRNQFMLISSVLVALLAGQYAAPYLNVICVLLPLLICVAILWHARTNLIPGAIDGTSWHGVKIIMHPDSRNARTHICFHNAITISDNPLSHDIFLKRDVVNDQRNEGKRGCIIFQRDDGTWWVRNIGERPIDVTSNGTITRLSTRAADPHMQPLYECPIDVGSSCSFYDRYGKFHSKIEFRGTISDPGIPNQPAFTSSSQITFWQLFHASIMHMRFALATMPLLVIAVSCLLYATDSGVYNSTSVLRPLNESMGNWQSLSLLYAMIAGILSSLFVGVDVLAVIKGRLTPIHTIRRPKSILLALFMILIMAGTVIGFRTEGRILGANHIQLIIDNPTLFAKHQATLADCNVDTPQAFRKILQAPSETISEPCLSTLNSTLSADWKRNAPGNTAEMLKLSIYGFAIASFLIWVYVWLLQATKKDLPAMAQQVLVTWWQHRIPAWINQWIAVGVSGIILVSACITRVMQDEEQRGIQLIKIFDIPLEVLRLCSFVAIIVTIIYPLYQKQITNTSTPTHNWVKRLFTHDIFRAGITLSLLVANAAITKDFGPYLAYILMSLFIFALNSTHRRWMIAIIIITISGFVSINIWRTQLAEAPLHNIITRYGGSATISWVLRPSDPAVVDDIAAQLQPYVTPNSPYATIYEQWYKSSGEAPLNCVQYTNANICATDSSLRQSIYAIISGGMVGMGPGLGLSNPPDPFAPPLVENIHNDFVFVVIFEEYGITGGLIILLIFYSITATLFIASQRILSTWGKVIAIAVGLWWSIPILLIISGNLRFIPFAGINTPFISYGNSTTLITIGMVCITLWVNTLPYKTIDTLSIKQMSNYQAIQVMMAVVTAGLIGCVIFMQNGWGINNDLHQQIQQLRNTAVVPGNQDYTNLDSTAKLGRRLNCLFVRKPILVTVQDAQQRTLIAVKKQINDCRSKALDTSPAQKYGDSLPILLDSLMTDAEYLKRLYYPQKNLMNKPQPIQLTIDGEVQRDIEAIFDRGTDARNRPISGQVIVVGYDGAIKTMVNRYIDIGNPSTGFLAGGTNNQFTGWFPPGSIWKPLMASAAITNGMQANDELPCNLGKAIQGFPKQIVNSFGAINCIYAAGSDEAKTNFSYALSYSVNTFFTGLTDASLETKNGELPGNLPLTREQVLAQLKKFGITKVAQRAPWSGWSLPNAQSANVAGRARDANNDFDNIDASAFGLSAIGQSVLASPLAMAAAMQIIANDGVAHTIHLVNGDTNRNWDNQQQLSVEHAQILQTLLKDTVQIPYTKPIVINNQSYRLAGAAAVYDEQQQLLVAGKTGTAEIEDDNNPYCVNTSDAQCPPLSWFVGFSPQSQSIVVVMLRYHDSDLPSPCSAAGIAGEIFDYLLHSSQPIPCIERGR